MRIIVVGATGTIGTPLAAGTPERRDPGRPAVCLSDMNHG